MNLQELIKQRAFAQNKAESIVKAAEDAGRQLTEAEASEFNTAMAAVQSLGPEIKKRERQNSIRQHLVEGKLIPAAGNLRHARTPDAPVVLSEDYYGDFYSWLGSRGQHMGAALYEGSNSAGGYAVPVIVDGNVVPLAPQEMGVRTIATVVPTATDIKIPTQSAYSTAASKAESGGSDNAFTESDPTLGQFTLSAFMAGVTHTLSFEILQDVPTFQNFALTDLLIAIQQYEEGKYVSGSGSGEAQGLLGNVGAGVTGVLVGTDNYGSELIDASFDVMGHLNAVYFNSNTRWLMARSTAIALRKAQKTANLFEPVFVSQNGKDYLHGIEVAYSSSMPAIGAGNTPILFGDFKQGYVIGDRGGSGVTVKILDQPKATLGQVILLGYRRTDGRVRRSEAIQAITLHT
jgi:HK97 family phage major capsid protein